MRNYFSMRQEWFTTTTFEKIFNYLIWIIKTFRSISCLPNNWRFVGVGFIKQFRWRENPDLYLEYLFLWAQLGTKESIHNFMTFREIEGSVRNWLNDCNYDIILAPKKSTNVCCIWVWIMDLKDWEWYSSGH